MDQGSFSILQKRTKYKEKNIITRPQDYFIGCVDLCMLEIITLLLKIFKKDMAFGITNSKSWHSLERLLYDAREY